MLISKPLFLLSLFFGNKPEVAQTLTLNPFISAIHTQNPCDHNSTAEEKHGVLLAKIMAKSPWTYADGVGDFHSALRKAGILLTEMNPVFDTPCDEMPVGRIARVRTKFIHERGAVASIRWEPVNDLPETHEFTGIFKGSDFGFARMSLVGAESPRGHTGPGMALKFLRSGVDSANLITMFSVAGQDSLNFFENNFTNPIPIVDPTGDFALKAIGEKFRTKTEKIFQLGVSDMAMYDQEGKKEASPVFPFGIRLEPTGAFKTGVLADLPAFQQTQDRGIIKELTMVTPNATLYRVFAVDKPVCLGGVEHHIANIVLDGPVVTSDYSDKHLFFRHQLMDDDLKIHPDWEPYTHEAYGNTNKTWDGRCLEITDEPTSDGAHHSEGMLASDAVCPHAAARRAAADAESRVMIEEVSEK